MSVPRLPRPVVHMLAARPMREHHAIWHLVRARWHEIPDPRRREFREQGWEPPRKNPLGGVPDYGAGVDFLHMHRRMIAAVNLELAAAAQPDYPRVAGWDPIPWDPQDVHWPMPPAFPEGDASAKDPEVTAHYRREVATKFDDPTWLRGVTVDALGSEIEGGIHNWMHMHWASAPWFKGRPGQDADDPRNDYLGSTYSSHVNEAFWKLHGWIDDRIRAWERANGRPADLSGGWEGPRHSHEHAPEHAPRSARAGAVEAPKHATPSVALTDEERLFSDDFFVRQAAHRRR